MKQFFLSATVMSCILLISCNSSQETNHTASTKDTTMTTTIEQSKNSHTAWYAGKRFTNDNFVRPDPREGGPDFMVINTNNTGEFKMGDIIETTTWTVTKDSLILNLQTSRKKVFIIKDSSLVDEYNTEWKIEK